MPTTIKPVSRFDFVGSIILILLFLGSVLIVWNVTRGGKTEKEAPAIEYRSITCPKEVNAFNTLNQDKEKHVAELISESYQMYAKDRKFVNLKVVVTKNETKDSKVACGYLYVKAHTDRNGGLQTYEDVYINPENFGGHLDKSNQFGFGDGHEFSEYIFSLDDIRYWKTVATSGTVLNADWASLLNAKESLTFRIALNTENTTGHIDKVSIVYKCRDPKTGEENTGCEVKASKPQVEETDKPIWFE